MLLSDTFSWGWSLNLLMEGKTFNNDIPVKAEGLSKPAPCTSLWPGLLSLPKSNSMSEAGASKFNESKEKTRFVINSREQRPGLRTSGKTWVGLAVRMFSTDSTERS